MAQATKLDRNNKIREILACVSVAIFNIIVGLISGFSAILIPQLDSADSNIRVDRTDVSWIVSIVALFWPIGGIFSGCIVDVIGRINTIRLSVPLYIIGWIFIAMAQNVPFIMIGRMLTAISVAFGGNTSILYITEVASNNNRGSMTSICPAFVSLGTLIGYTLGYFFHWRTVSWIALIICFPCVIAMTVWSPESPIWLVSKGRKQDALKSIKYLLGNDREDVAEARLVELVKEHISRPSTGSTGAKLLRAITKPDTYKPALLLLILFTFEHFSGIYITMFYAVVFFNTVGTDIDPYICSILNGSLRFLSGFVTILLLKKFGRRTLLFVSCFGMAISMSISGYFTREISFGNMEKNVVPVICILLYIILSVTGLMTIPWTMAAEFFPPEIRGIAQSFMTTITVLILFSSLKVYPFLDDFFGGSYVVQWFFAATCITAAIFIFIFIPEFHGKDLSEIQDYFNNNTFYFLSKDKPRKKVVKDIVAEEETVTLKSGV